MSSVRHPSADSLPRRCGSRGQAALVAGGASGLGEATARALVDGRRRGDDRRPQRREGRGARRRARRRGRFVEANVTEPSAVAAAVERRRGRGGLRISVCCAGIGWAQRIAHKGGPHDLEMFNNVIKVNLIGTFNVLRLAAAAMNDNEPDEEGERGVCVNTASIAAYDGQIGQVAYSASKGGVVGMTLPAARDLAARGIRVDHHRPGPLRHAAAGGAARGARARRSAPGSPSPRGSAAPRSTRELVAEIVANTMLNGETIRLDGALRMPPK